MRAQFEYLNTKPGHTLNAFMFKKAEFDAPFHFHPEYELTFILSSSGTRYTGNHFGDFKENDMVLLGPHLPHCWKNFAGQKATAAAIVIHWDKDLIDDKWLDREEFINIKNLFHYAANGVRFGNQTAAVLRHRLTELTKLGSFEKFHAFLSILQQLALCKDIELLASQNDLHGLNYNNNERIGLALEYIRQNFAQKISLADMANRNKMTEEAFSRFFSKVMRKSFFCYLNEYRINHACTQLIETDKSVSEICYSSGYDTQPFFFRQFRKFKGCTPGDYRANYLHTVSWE